MKASFYYISDCLNVEQKIRLKIFCITVSYELPFDLIIKLGLKRILVRNAYTFLPVIHIIFLERLLCNEEK